MANGKQAFEQRERTPKEQRLEGETERLKTVVGELTMKLKCASRAIGKAASSSARSDEDCCP